MRLTAQCRHCGVPMFVECSDDYADLRDPFGLVKLLSCPKCIAKYQEHSRREYHAKPKIVKLEAEILNRANWISREREFGGVAGKQAQQELRTACESFAACLAELHDSKPLEVAGLLEALVDLPGEAKEHLKRFREAVQYEAKAVKEGA